MGEVLILGLGNDILSDDAIGPKLVQRLEGDISEDRITFLTAAVGGMEIMELMKDYNHAIIIDAIKTKVGVPGAVYHFTPDHFEETLHASSFHDVSFLTAIELAKKIDINLPKQIDIIAIEILEDLVFSDELSPPLKREYDFIYVKIYKLVKELIN